MATLVFGAIGAAIGSIWGQPMQGWAIGTIVGGILFPPGMEKQSRGKLDDLRVSGSAYGSFIQQLWGDERLAGMVIWASELVENRSSVGGKGGGGVDQYSYTVSCAVLACRGPVDSVRKIWANDLVIYDALLAPPTTRNVTVYLGGESQDADPTMSAWLSAHSLPCPAHRGECYVVFTDLDLTPWGSAMPNFSLQVRTCGEEEA